MTDDELRDLDEYMRGYVAGREESREERKKLREQIHWLKKGDILHVLTDQELAEQQKHEREIQASIKALDDENAELRELVSDLLMPRLLYGVYRCEDEDMTLSECIEWADADLRRRARKLGVKAEIEVDG